MSLPAASESRPVIYLLNGDDEFAIAQYIAKIQAELGDASLLAMNLTKLDGRTYHLGDLRMAAGSMPFLTNHRLVILEHPTARLNSPELQKEFKVTLEKTPASTTLVLVEYKVLTEKKDRDKNKQHWLEEWAFGAGERVRIKRFDLPKVEEMPRWILEKAKGYGGRFTRDAANDLATLIGDEPRLADQEIQKLLAYVNYRRPVERDDVQFLTADMREGDIFAMVDAIGAGNVKRAMEMLQRLMEQEDPIGIFAMIVRQFRLILQAREVLDHKGTVQDVAREVRLHPYVAEKVSGQARRFSMPLLEQIYRHLLEIDTAMKTSQMPGELALETLVAALGNLHPVHTDPDVVW
jgi:DNA polymerase III subunit delta